MTNVIVEMINAMPQTQIPYRRDEFDLSMVAHLLCRYIGHRSGT
jgi:hypothetical protein